MKATTKRQPDLDHGGLIQPAAMFERPLPRPFLLDAHLPFGERVERAWARLMAGFEENEHKRLREVLVQIINGERRGSEGVPE